MMTRTINHVLVRICTKPTLNQDIVSCIQWERGENPRETPVATDHPKSIDALETRVADGSRHASYISLTE